MGVTGCYTSALHHHSSTEQFKLQGKSTKCILQPDQVTEELYFATGREEGKIGFVSNFCHTELTKNYSPQGSLRKCYCDRVLRKKQDALCMWWAAHERALPGT